jgi:hypothetical protein
MSADTKPSALLLAVIAAAVHAVCGQRLRVVAVTLATSPDSDWAREGRRDIFSSHRLR